MTQENTAKWGTLLSCSLSCFIAWLDFAIVNTALPAIKIDLSATLLQLQWVINAYLLAIGVLIVILGRISDNVGRKRINILGAALFGLASLFAGFAMSPNWLIMCRLLQGVASAAIIPTSLALISQAFPGEEKGKAIGIWSGITGFGMALGPVLGGILVSTLSWRWIFFINVPFSIASIILTLFYINESNFQSTFLKPDYKGFAILTLGLGSLIFGLMHAPDWGWISAKTWIVLAVGVFAVAWFYQSEKSCPSPTIPFDLFSTKAFLSSTIVMFGLLFVFNADIFIIPLYLIQIRELEAYQAGFAILPITACIAGLSPLVGHLKVAKKKLVLFGLLVFGASTVLQSFIEKNSSIYYILFSFACLGVGWAFVRLPATTAALDAAPEHCAGTASGVLWTFQNAGGALSIAISLTIFRAISQSSTDSELFLAGYHTVTWLLSLVTLTVFFSYAFLMRPNKN